MESLLTGKRCSLTFFSAVSGTYRCFHRTNSPENSSCYPFFDLRYSRGDTPIILLNSREK